MRITITILLLFAVSNTFSQGPYVNKAAKDAYLITRMANKFHVRPRPVDAGFSSDMFIVLLKSLDQDKMYFTMQDFHSLEKYRYKLGEQVKNRETTFLQLLISVYKERLTRMDTMITSICKKPFPLELAEKYTITEDTTYPADNSSARVKLYKELKLDVIESIVDAQKEMKIIPTARKKVTDSLEIIARHSLEKSFRRYIQKQLQGPGGIEAVVSEKYCNAVACCYDPHSEYMSLTGREKFEGELGNKKLSFGFSLDEDDAGNVVIKDLKPGSPAFQSGQINSGDKLMSVQWEGSKAIDLSGAGIEEIANILEQSNHDKAVLTVKKADGSIKQIALNKEALNNDNADDEKVKSFILKGQKTIGYISLPDFYEDWEHKVNVNGCANDVASEVMKLKKENIDGLIIDLRFNGGGSLKEAVELAGIFIDAGPVAIEAGREGKNFTWKDVNRGTVYDGPLLIMVNGYTASASELFAGCLQDYNRAVIAGSTTYGKATGQGILPLDTTISLDRDLNERQAESYLKLTMMQIYRVSGSTAQFKGIIPDIHLPDATEIKKDKERDELFAINATNVEANKYYKPEKPLTLQPLKDLADNILKTDPYFKTVQERIVKSKERINEISLKLSDHLKSSEDSDDDLEKDSTLTPLFSVEYNTYDQQRLKGNTELMKMDEVWSVFLKKDVYVKAAFRLVSVMK